MFTTIIERGKTGKVKTEATNFISLTSCMVKLLEQIINTRLKGFLKTEKLLVSQPAGFREHKLYIRISHTSSTCPSHTL